MKRMILSLGAAALLAACGGSEPAAPAAPETAPEPAAEPAKTDAAPAQAEASQPSADGWIKYGSDMSSNAAIPSAKVLASTADYVGKTIKVEGNVAKVCQSMGCWLSFEDGEHTLTVNMKDHAFSVDKKGAGYWCEAEGTVEKIGEEYAMTAHAVRMKAPDKPAEGEAPKADEAPSKG